MQQSPDPNFAPPTSFAAFEPSPLIRARSRLRLGGTMFLAVAIGRVSVGAFLPLLLPPSESGLFSPPLLIGLLAFGIFQFVAYIALGLAVVNASRAIARDPAPLVFLFVALPFVGLGFFRSSIPARHWIIGLLPFAALLVAWLVDRLLGDRLASTGRQNPTN